MKKTRVQEFREEREYLTKLTLADADLKIKRFFALDHAAYEDGVIPPKYKEMMGLACSMVLRCDDCISYHLDQCQALGVTKAELQEVLNIALIVGGSIVIPHLRRAVAYWEELESLN
ncbi:MAG: hypothetical protein PWP64_1159 [Candidatus Cloacimonadota bacterium]|jgi:AhpD family alkylhydroperoxidase|nr:hypothetical protein [Candidatus Cloacimonadota bacterium]